MLEKILKYITIIGLFAILFIPLYVSSSLFFPFITGKNFVFRIIVEILLGNWILLALLDKKYRPKLNAILISITSFVLIIGAANIFGENTLKAFWGNFERMEGWITLIHLLAYFIILGSVLNTEKLWLRFFNVSVFVSILLGIYSLTQKFGGVTIHQGGSRIDATLGNATYLAGYMLFHIFITLFLLIRHRKYLFLKILYFFVILLQVYTLLNTATRGAILGVFGGFFVFALIIALFEKEKPKLRKTGAGVIILLLVFGGGVFLLRDTSLIKNQSGLNRVSSITLDQKTVRSRFMVWNMAWQGFKEKPLLGWGQEGFNFVFNKYYNPKMYDQEPWFDRAHNTFLDWLIAGGLLGILAYLSIHFSYLFCLWKRKSFSFKEMKMLSGDFSKSQKNRKKLKKFNKETEKRGRFSVLEKSVLIGLLAAYGFHSIFVFDNLTSYIMFFVILAYVYHRSVHGLVFEENENLKEPAPLSWQSKIKKIGTMLVIVVLTLLIVWSVNANGIKRARYLVYAVNPTHSDVSVNLKLFNKSANLNTPIGFQEVAERMVEFSSRLPNKKDVSDKTKQKFFERSKELMEEQISRVPQDARQYIFFSTLLNNFGKNEKVLKSLKKAHKLSPQKQTIIMQIGLTYISKGDFENGLSWLKKAYKLAPDFKKANMNYAVGAVYAGENKLARNLLEKGFGTTTLTNKKLLQAYVSKNQSEKVVAIMKKEVKRNPKNVRKIISLAAAYLKNGEKEKSIRELEQAIEIKPSFKEQGERYIKKIKSGEKF